MVSIPCEVCRKESGVRGGLHGGDDNEPLSLQQVRCEILFPG